MILEQVIIIVAQVVLCNGGILVQLMLINARMQQFVLRLLVPLHLTQMVFNGYHHLMSKHAAPAAINPPNPCRNLLLPICSWEIALSNKLTLQGIMIYHFINLSVMLSLHSGY